MDSRILSELYKAYAREIYLYLYSLCKDSHLAEDLMQESFCKAILALSPEHTNMRAWLYTVARNLCLNELKKRSRETCDENLPDFSGFTLKSAAKFMGLSYDNARVLSHRAKKELKKYLKEDGYEI